MLAQRAFQSLGLAAAVRPRIARTNLVCAEPMPGEGRLRREFTAKLQPRLLGQLVEAIVEKMTLAGEAGSLLRIEEEIRAVVARAKQQWQAVPKAEQLLLFPESRRPKAEQLGLFDVSAISDEAFWETAEAQILAALYRYAAEAENGQGYSRRLFAEDAERGFAFVRGDVVSEIDLRLPLSALDQELHAAVGSRRDRAPAPRGPTRPRWEGRTVLTPYAGSGCALRTHGDGALNSRERSSTGRFTMGRSCAGRFPARVHRGQGECRIERGVGLVRSAGSAAVQ